MKDLFEIRDQVKQIMLNKGIIKECSCGQKFYRTPYYSDDNMLYGAITNYLKEIFTEEQVKENRSFYLDAVKEILNETFIGDSCDNCGDKW